MRRGLLVGSILLLVVVFAAALRFPDLAEVPFGLHGDEAAAGLEARRIRAEGWIGVYSAAAAGNPTGYYHLVALTTALSGDSIAGLRTTSALLGVVTVCLLFLVMLRDFGLLAASVASALLSVSVWHRIFSRMAHVNIAWPAMVLLALLALERALRTGSRAWWAAAGMLLGAGVYFYNGHLLLLVTIGGIAAPILLTLLVRGRLALPTMAAFTLGLVAAALPLLTYIARHPEQFVGRAGAMCLINSPEWQGQPGRFARSRLLAGRYLEAWDRLSIHPEPTPIDLTGVVPLVTPAALLLSGAGVVLGVRRYRTPAFTGGVLVVVAMPMVPAMFTDFALRRAFVLAPFLAMFAGIAAAELVSLVRHRRLTIQLAMGVCLSGWLVTIGYQELDAFRTTMKASNTRWALGPELVEATRYMDGLPSTTFIHFFSVRWPLGHEVVRLLAPAVRGETRGAPYGRDSLEIERTEDEHVVILLDDYRDHLPLLAAKYPGGTAVVGARSRGADDGPSYLAYVLPPITR